jgi:hypothetical protein
MANHHFHFFQYHICARIPDVGKQVENQLCLNLLISRVKKTVFSAAEFDYFCALQIFADL